MKARFSIHALMWQGFIVFFATIALLPVPGHAGEALVGQGGYSAETHTHRLQQIGVALKLVRRNISLIKQCQEFKVLQEKYIPAIIANNKRIEKKIKRLRLTEDKTAEVRVKWSAMLADIDAINRWLHTYFETIKTDPEIVSGDIYVSGHPGNKRIRVPDQRLDWVGEKMEDLEYTMVTLLGEGYSPEVKAPPKLIYLDFNRRYLPKDY